MKNNTEKTDGLLISLRKIMRAVDLHSKQLQGRYGLTGPQMLLLKYVFEAGKEGIISSQLAKKASLSMATITSIMDRLQKNKYIKKVRDQNDKRKTYIIATDVMEWTRSTFTKLTWLTASMCQNSVVSYLNLTKWRSPA